MAEDWTESEVELIIADYFSMLADELEGKPYNKSEHRRNLLPLLNNRSHSSVENKHQNISAKLIQLGLPYIQGYKPYSNAQKILLPKIIDYLTQQKNLLEPKFIHFAESNTFKPKNIDFNLLKDLPPEKKIIAEEPIVEYEKRPIKINYLEKEQNNLTLGARGESLIIEYEKWRLINAGKLSLADKIEWVSKHDDAAGFDILSKYENGKDLYIEVKTTKLSKDAPIFFSKNEYDFSQSKKQDFHLYRLFNFEKDPKLFTLPGSFDDFCTKEPINYKGIF